MQNNNNNDKKNKYIGVSEGQYFDINKTYKNVNISKGKFHTLFLADTFKDETGTWIKTGSYQLRWYSDEDFNVGDKIKIVKIKHVEQNTFNSKAGIRQYLINMTVEVQKMQNQYSNYNNNNSQYSQYSNYNNNFQQPQEYQKQSQYNSYDDYYNGYNNYNNNNNGNDDFGL